jgi:hypothetical protein
MHSVEGCSVCEETKRTIVCEYNRLIFHDSMWDKDLARYEYALCHGCGLVYATRRPDRSEYEFLYKNFSEFLLRAGKKDLEAPALTPNLVEKIDHQFLPWWELRGAPRAGLNIRAYLANDFERSLRYLPSILASVKIEGAKVLYIRAKASSLVDVLRRVFGAKQVDVTTLFPAVAYLCEKNTGVRAICDVDFDNFRIPFPEKYDLIIENHILIHMIDPKSTFSMMIEHLNDRGTLFLRNELDDSSMFRKKKNLFGELRPFHFNHFDVPTLKRMLRSFGFDPVGVQARLGGKSEVFGPARLDKEARKQFRPISRDQLNDRLKMYAQWRDESILWLPTERCRALFGNEVRRVWQRFDKWHGLGSRMKKRKFGEAKIPNQEIEFFAGAMRGKPSVFRPYLLLAKKKLFTEKLLRVMPR